jgi:hypothetical protein
VDHDEILHLVDIANNLKDIREKDDYRVPNAIFLYILEDFLTGGVVDTELELETDDPAGGHGILQGHYDLFVLRIKEFGGDICLCMPAPLMAPLTILAATKQAKIVEKVSHQRTVRVAKAGEREQLLRRLSKIIELGQLLKLTEEYFDRPPKNLIGEEKTVA